MNQPIGFSVRIFIPTGEPEGLRIVEKSNWTGHGIVFPRAKFAEVRQRSELRRTGVYILWGPGESGQLPRVYVGEGDDVLPRLDLHAKQKDFWTHAVVFTSKDQNLNKAHVQYLESRLVVLAREAKRAELDNGNIPQVPALSEADTADAEGFLGDLLLCLPIVGIAVFEMPKTPSSSQPKLFLRMKGVEARGCPSPEGFVVLSGSSVAKKEVLSIPSHIKALRDALIDAGVLRDTGEYFQLQQDYAFNSPSAAASVVMGCSINGRGEWKDVSGKSLGQIQQQEEAPIP